MVEFIVETAVKCFSELSASNQLLEVRCVFDCRTKRFWATKNWGWEKRSLFFSSLLLCLRLVTLLPIWVQQAE